MHALDRSLAARWTDVALHNVTRPYPYKFDQLVNAPEDVAPPDRVHPAFWGSYDWHSCVHMHWTIARLLRRFPDHDRAGRAQRHLIERLTAAHIDGEVQALLRPGHASFERPYGWGWLLKLAAELRRLAEAQPTLAAAADGVAPLAQVVAERLLAFLPKADYPSRTGAHGNTAFALLLALDYAEALPHGALAARIAERTAAWFGNDRRYPADYEPSGDDFLSAGLVEAVLVRRTVDASAFDEWWERFEPTAEAMAAWLTPARVGDEADPKIVHLHGLNLSRAWCWRQLLPNLPARLAPRVERTIAEHLHASLPVATAGDYVSTHWLASFAVLALDGP